MSKVTIGEFSISPVIAAAHALGLDSRYGVDLHTTSVSSSPGQFGMLDRGEIDFAITSPDNVLLYGTTDKQPLGHQLDLRIHRAIDRGLGLSLVTRPDIDDPSSLATANLGVDVVRSGFALLLFTMLDRLGIDHTALEFQERGSTPARAEALLSGEIDGTILNAESLVRAQDAGMRVWMSAADVSPRYLGTVLACATDRAPAELDAVLALWDEATAWLLDGPATDVRAALASTAPTLGTEGYLALLRGEGTGLSRTGEVTPADLEVLAEIRRERGAYAPEADQLPALVGE